MNTANNSFISKTRRVFGSAKSQFKSVLQQHLTVETIYIILVLLTLISLTSIILSFINPLEVSSENIRYIIVGSTLFFMLMVALLYISTTKTVNSNTVFEYLSKFIGMFLSGGLFMFLAMLPFAIVFAGSQYFSNSLFFLGAIILIITTALILYTFFRAFLTKQDDDSVGGLIKNTILYLPCLVIDFVEFVKVQYKITSAPYWILLIVDIVLISIFLSNIDIKNTFDFSSKKTLLKDPIYLNKEKIVGNYEDLKKHNENHKTNDKWSKNTFEYSLK